MKIEIIKPLPRRVEMIQDDEGNYYVIPASLFPLLHSCYYENMNVIDEMWDDFICKFRNFQVDLNQELFL